MDVSYIHTTQAKLNTVPKANGQIVIVTDASPENNRIYVDFLDTTTNTVVRHLLTTQNSLSMEVNLSNGHLMYQYDA